jgi:hypothetical protein
MKRLDPEARRVLELASAARTPSAQDKARVARRVAAAVGAGASAAVPLNVAHAAKISSAGKWALVAGVSKAWIGAAALLATALSGYVVWSNAAATPPNSHEQGAATPLKAAGPGVSTRESRSQTAAVPLTAAGAGFRPRPEPAPAAPLEMGARSAAAPASSTMPGTQAIGSNAAPATAEIDAAASARATLNSVPATRAATNRAAARRPVPSAPASAHTPLEPAAATGAQPHSAASDTLDAELDLLHRAQVAWRAREAAGALALLNEHRARFPRSTLQLERDALQVLTLCELGKTADAARLARGVLAAAPHSPLRASLEESCALK